MKCDLPVYYSDFRELCRVKDNKIWCPWLDVRPDGVYLNPPAKELDGEEKTDWYRHHQTKNLAEPVLRFPCSISDLESFQEEYSVYGCIDAFDMADWVFSKAFGRLNPALSAEYYSDDLKTLNRAAFEFWSNSHPDDKITHPKNDEVEKWLKEQDFSGVSAKQGATIIRPKWGAKGRR